MHRTLVATLACAARHPPSVMWEILGQILSHYHRRRHRHRRATAWKRPDRAQRHHRP